MTTPKVLTPEQIHYKANEARKLALKIERRYLHRICGSRHLACEVWVTEAEDRVWEFHSRNQYGHAQGYAAIAGSPLEARTMAIDLRSMP